jgi:hypothetical protein
MVIPLPQRLLTAALAALVPAVVFNVVSVLSADPTRLTLDDGLTGVLISLGVVWVLSLIPLAVSRHVVAFAGVLVVMTCVAAVAGYLVVTIDDAQAGLAILYVSYVALPLAMAVGLIQAVVGGAERRRWWRAHPVGSPAVPTDTAPARAGLRVAALLIDTLALGAVLAYPLTSLSHARLETVAAVGGIAVAVAYLAVGTSGTLRTLGQVLVGVAVVGHRDGGPVGAGRATVRGLLIVVEVLATLTLWGVPVAVVDLVVVRLGGRSLIDLLLRTAVVVPVPSHSN